MFQVGVQQRGHVTRVLVFIRTAEALRGCCPCISHATKTDRPWPGVSAMLCRATFDPNVSFLEKMRHGSTGIMSSEAQRDTSNVHAVCACGMTPAA